MVPIKKGRENTQTGTIPPYTYTHDNINFYFLSFVFEKNGAKERDELLIELLVRKKEKEKKVGGSFDFAFSTALMMRIKQLASLS